MSRNEMVRVPRELLDASAEWLEALSDPNSAERGVAQDLREILAQPAEQHQGEPVAWRYRVHPGGHWFVTTRKDIADLYRDTADGGRVEDLHTHAAPGEVERLREEIQSLRKALPNSTTELVDLRAQLAELSGRMAVINRKATEYACTSIPTGPECRFGDEIAALSASAEPSAPECNYCGDTGQIMVGRSGDANDGNAPIMEPCEDCDRGAPVERMATIRAEAARLSESLKASACQKCMSKPCDCSIQSSPVEGDERAAFERAFVIQEGVFFSPERKEYRSMNGRTIEETDSIDLNLRLSGWRARAALERKPS